MSWLLLASVLAFTPDAVENYPTTTEAAAAMHEELQTGALLFSEGDCLAVRVFTQSPYTHVAAVVIRNGQPFVYESANGAGVRCQTLKNYLSSQQPAVVHVVQPAKPLSESQVQAFSKSLDSHLGRPYGIKHHLTGQRAEGVHCAEYVMDALQEAKLLRAKQPPKVSPASLLTGALQSEVYSACQTVHIGTTSVAETSSEQNAEEPSWCRKLWLDTKTCTLNSCAKVRGWFLCR